MSMRRDTYEGRRLPGLSIANSAMRAMQRRPPQLSTGQRIFHAPNSATIRAHPSARTARLGTSTAKERRVGQGPGRLRGAGASLAESNEAVEKPVFHTSDG